MIKEEKEKKKKITGEGDGYLGEKVIKEREEKKVNFYWVSFVILDCSFHFRPSDFIIGIQRPLFT